MLARMTLAVLPSATSSIFLLEGCVNNSAKIFCFFAKKQIISVMMLPRPLQIAYFSALSERLPLATLQKAYKFELSRSTNNTTIHSDYERKTIVIDY